MVANILPGSFRVTTAYTATYPNPIAFEAGDLVTVGRADDEFIGWYWSTGPDGREGWVHQRYLSVTAGAGTALADYDARELSVTPGQYVEVQRIESGWAWSVDASGEAGWVPLSNIAACEQHLERG